MDKKKAFKTEILYNVNPTYVLNTNSNVSPVYIFLFTKNCLILILFKQIGCTLSAKKSSVCRFRKSCIFVFVFDISWILAILVQ